MPALKAKINTNFFKDSYKLVRARGVWQEQLGLYTLLADSQGLWVGLGQDRQLAGNLLTLSGQPEAFPRLLRKHPGLLMPNLSQADRWGFTKDQRRLMAHQYNGQIKLTELTSSRLKSIFPKAHLPTKLVDYLDWFLPQYLNQPGWIDPRPLLALIELPREGIDKSFLQQAYKVLSNQLWVGFSAKPSQDLGLLARRSAVAAWWQAHFEILLALYQLGQQINAKDLPRLQVLIEQQLEKKFVLIGWDLPWFDSFMSLSRYTPVMKTENFAKKIDDFGWGKEVEIRMYKNSRPQTRTARKEWPLAIEDCLEFTANLYSA